MVTRYAWRRRAARMSVIALEDDKVLRFLQVLVDPSTSAERMAVFKDYVAHDIDQDAWIADVKARLPGVFPSDVRLIQSKDDLRAALPDAEALVVESMAIGEAELALAPRLKFIHKFGIRADNIDLAACARRGIAVKTQRRRTNIAVAEHTLALMLALAKQLHRAGGRVTEQQLRERGYIYRKYDTRHTGANNYGRVGGLRVLHGLTLGLLGMGEIAREVAPLARAFGLNLQYHRRNRLPAAEETALGVRHCSWNDLFETSDIVSVHVPLAPETRGLVGADALQRIKPGAWLINTSRADIVDHDALVAALASGRLAAAACDVHYQEPVSDDEPLLKFDNLLLTPHFAGGPRQTLLIDIEEIASNIQQALAPYQKANANAQGKTAP
jgi:phosphoglycerate dehydrogenase-like enzyme